MNATLLLAAMMLIFSFYSCTQSNQNQSSENQEAEPGAVTDSDTLTLESGPVTLKVDRANGARIVSLQFQQKELLTGPEIHPENYGSTLWTAPQRAWRWPPYPVLDRGPYAVVQENDGLEFTSATDSTTGLQFIKIFDPLPADTAISITYRIKNNGQNAWQGAPWEVTRVPSEGLIFYQGDQAQVLEKTNLPYEQVGELVVFEPEKYPLEEAKKLFANGEGGWLAHWRDQVLFVKKFPDLSPGQVAPGEEEVEVYIHQNKDYIELENQGAYQELAPGDSLEWEVRWYLREESQSDLNDLQAKIMRINAD